MMSISALLLLLGQATTEPATIQGTVQLGHRPPPRPRIDVRSEPKANLHWPDGIPAQHLILGRDQGVQGAFVWIKKGLEGREYPVPPAEVTVTFDKFLIQPR